MGTRLGKRVIHFPNLPIKLLMPSSLSNIREFAIKTIPSASKIEIRRVLESLYGFHVAEVRTLNMEGKKRKRGGVLIAKPDYKKAFITLRGPLSLSADIFPIRHVEEERVRTQEKGTRQSVVGDGGEGDEGEKHWLGGERRERKKEIGGRRAPGERKERNFRSRVVGLAVANEEGGRFPWSSMRLGKK